MMFVFLGTLSCKETTEAEEQEEIKIQKVDSLEREMEQINQRIDSIKNEAEQVVNEINQNQ